jgi:hypothetical protein
MPKQAAHPVPLPCDLVAAGKMRNGAAQWWCRTHLKHWGVKADLAAELATGQRRCANHLEPMSYEPDPLAALLDDSADVAIFCALPPAIGNATITPATARIRVGVQIVDAVVLQAGESTLHITPPAAYEFMLALESGLSMGCVDCRECGHPHWDRGEFGSAAHRKHLCANCGRHTTWSKTAFVSTPLRPLRDSFSHAHAYVDATDSFDLDAYLASHPDATFSMAPTTPALIWTAPRAQRRGVAIQLCADGDGCVDMVIGRVMYQGVQLDRAALWPLMLAHTLP